MLVLLEPKLGMPVPALDASAVRLRSGVGGGTVAVDAPTLWGR